MGHCCNINENKMLQNIAEQIVEKKERFRLKGIKRVKKKKKKYGTENKSKKNRGGGGEIAQTLYKLVDYYFCEAISFFSRSPHMGIIGRLTWS